MRIKRLDLKAFGPFTSQTLEFDSKDPGLHIIFGPNEAGKSSSLRALKALLYGFPQQTPDNFIHSYDQLLVGGSLELSDAKKIYFQRRKKRTADVIDEKGDPLDPALIAPFIHSVEPEIFETLYGIDHQTLVQGGKDILAQKGEVGQALFAAGAGISSLRDVIDQLEKEAAELFKPSGQIPTINKALKKYKELQKVLREVSLSSTEWKTHQKALENAEAERDSLEKTRDQQNKELRRLERLEQAIPELASLKAWQEQLQALGEVTLLPPNFNDRHHEISQEIHETKLHLHRSSEKLKQLEEKRNGITFNRELLNHAERVDDFHQRLGEYRKGQKDRPERNGMRINLRKEAALLLKQVRSDLPLEKVETLRPMLIKKRTIQELSRQYEGLKQQLRQAEQQSKTAKEELQAIEESLGVISKPKKSDGLLKAVKLAQKAGDVDAHLEKNRGEIDQGKKECHAELKRIGLWTGDLAKLMELSLPLSETVQQFETEYSDIADERRGLRKDRKNAEKELKSVLSEIKKLEYAGEVPSEENLIQVREKRDQGWQLLRRQWLESDDVAEESLAYDPKNSLPEAYEGQIKQADQIADRLRREADRVASSAALRAQVENLQDTLAEHDRHTEILDQREQKLNEAWAKVWESAKVVPLSSKEMRGWLVEMEKLRYRVGEIFIKEEEAEDLVKRRAGLRQTVLIEIKAMDEEGIPAGEELGAILVFAETVLERITTQKTDYEKLIEGQKKTKNDLEQANGDLDTAHESMADWQEQWQKSLSGLGLKEEPSTLEAIDLIEALQSCFNKLKDADDLQKRIEGIDRDADRLKKDVGALLEKVAPEMTSLPLDQAILQLRTLLGQSQTGGTKFGGLSEEIDALQEEISTVEKTLQSSTEQMNELLQTAKCEKPEKLAAVISKFTEYQRLQEKISDTEASLAKIGAGVSIKKLREQATEVDADELPGRIEGLQRDVDERINPEINRISQIIGEETTKLAAMDGSAKAAWAAESMAQELARIRRLADRYTRIKLASKVLQQEIERYRAEHQDPILKIAASYFSELTLHSFAGLRADVDDRGEPVLVGIRPDDTRLQVGGMSDGTCDQLYLALRLATLEWRLQSSEPMPFIVDDILVNFDDDRSKTTLKALADLAGKNQVILFTHHQQIINDAKKIKGKGSVNIHTL